MTFEQYLQGLGFAIINSLPICGMLYLTIRLAFQHADKSAARRAAGKAEKKTRQETVSED